MARYGDKGRRGVWLVWANLAFPVLLFMFAHVSQLPVALVLAYGLGVGFMLQFTIINTLLQTQVADAMRGRVLSLYTLTFFGFAPFGNLAMGTLAEGWGLSMTIGLSAALSLTLALAVIALVPRLRGLR
jgi:hypothetical protein